MHEPDPDLPEVQLSDHDLIETIRPEWQRVYSLLMAQAGWEFGSAQRTGLGLKSALASVMEITEANIKTLDAIQRYAHDPDASAPPPALPKKVKDFAAVAPALAPKAGKTPDGKQKVPDDKHQSCFQPLLRRGPLTLWALLAARGQDPDASVRVRLHELMLGDAFDRARSKGSAMAWTTDKRGSLHCLVSLVLCGYIESDDEPRVEFAITIDSVDIVPPPRLLQLDDRDRKRALEQAVCNAVDDLLGTVDATAAMLRRDGQKVAADLIDALTLIVPVIEFGPPRSKGGNDPAHCLIPGTSLRLLQVLVKHGHACALRVDAMGHRDRDVSGGKVGLDVRGRTKDTRDLLRYAEDLSVHQDGSPPHRHLIERLQLDTESRALREPKPDRTGKKHPIPRPLRSRRHAFVASQEGSQLPVSVVYFKADAHPVTTWVIWQPSGTHARPIFHVMRQFQPWCQKSLEHCSTRWKNHVAVRLRLHLGSHRCVDGLQGLADMANSSLVLLSFGWRG